MNTRKLALSAVAALMIASAPHMALAKQDNPHAKPVAAHHQPSKAAKKDVVVQINNYDRKVIREYLKDNHRRNCPPGLAKKNPECVPPGKVKWRKGHALPKNVTIVKVSSEFRKHLNPLPKGYEYVQVDNDILLIASATKKVIDAVTLLSAVGK